VTLIVALFLVVSLDHMRLGMKEIIEDYIHGEGGKLTLFALNTFFAIAVGVVSLFALAKLAFGG
jgi:succinate dehydrogenase / fumarate reductase membrane anchor subunit